VGCGRKLFLRTFPAFGPLTSWNIIIFTKRGNLLDYFHYLTRQAHEIVKNGEIGTASLVSVRKLIAMGKHNPYFHTAWRKEPEFQVRNIHIAHVSMH